MKEPLSEYEECNEPTKKSYEDYKEEREQLIEENTEK
jgi:hypothetical protein